MPISRRDTHTYGKVKTHDGVKFPIKIEVGHVFIVEDLSEKLWVLPINCHQSKGFGNESFSLRRSILLYFIASTVQFTVVHGSKGVMLSCLLYLV